MRISILHLISSILIHLPQKNALHYPFSPWFNPATWIRAYGGNPVLPFFFLPSPLPGIPPIIKVDPRKIPPLPSPCRQREGCCCLVKWRKAWAARQQGKHIALRCMYKPQFAPPSLAACKEPILSAKKILGKNHATTKELFKRTAEELNLKLKIKLLSTGAAPKTK